MKTLYMNLFNEKPFHTYEQARIKELKDNINSISEFPEAIESEAEGFAEDFFIRHLSFDKSGYQNDIKMERVPININRGEMSRDGYKTVAYVYYSLKVNWDRKQKQLAHYHSTSHGQPSLGVNFLENPGVIQFGIETTYSQPELPEHIVNEVVKEREQVFADLQTTLNCMNEDIDRFNGQLYQIALQAINERKRYTENMASIKAKL